MEAEEQKKKELTDEDQARAFRQQTVKLSSTLQQGDEAFINGKFPDAAEHYARGADFLRKMDARLPADVRWKEAMTVEIRRRNNNTLELLPKEAKKDVLEALRERRAKEAADLSSQGNSADSPRTIIKKNRRQLKDACDRIKRSIATSLEERARGSVDESGSSRQSDGSIVVPPPPSPPKGPHKYDAAEKIATVVTQLEADMCQRRPVVRPPAFSFNGVRGLKQLEAELENWNAPPTSRSPLLIEEDTGPQAEAKGPERGADFDGEFEAGSPKSDSLAPHTFASKIPTVAAESEDEEEECENPEDSKLAGRTGDADTTVEKEDPNVGMEVADATDEGGPLCTQDHHQEDDEEEDGETIRRDNGGVMASTIVDDALSELLENVVLDSTPEMRLAQLVGEPFVPSVSTSSGGGDFDELEAAILRELSQRHDTKRAKRVAGPYAVGTVDAALAGLPVDSEALPYGMASQPYIGRTLRRSLGLNPKAPPIRAEASSGAPARVMGPIRDARTRRVLSEALVAQQLHLCHSTRPEMGHLASQLALESTFARSSPLQRLSSTGTAKHPLFPETKYVPSSELRHRSMP